MTAITAPPKAKRPAIEIDTHVPPPGAEAVRRAAIFPWRAMNPGDSIFIAGYGTKPSKVSGMTQMSAIRGRVAFPGSKWTVREYTEDGVLGVRVWRLS